MANNPYLYPMKYLLFYIISLLSLTACIHEELPPEGGFALEEGDPLPEFSISNPDGTVSKKDLENKFALIIFLQYDLFRLPEGLPGYFRKNLRNPHRLHEICLIFGLWNAKII